MKTRALLFVFIVFLLIGTNPSLARHQEKVREVAVAESEKELGDGIVGSVAKFVGVADTVGAIVASSVGRVNLVVCSLGTCDGSIVSFGALGCVIAW